MHPYYPMVQGGVGLYDTTIPSCVPGSLKAVLDTLHELTIHLPVKKSPIVSHIWVESKGEVADLDHPKNFTQTFDVKIGFNVTPKGKKKPSWHMIECTIKYWYAPRACSSTDIRSCSIKRQIGEHNDDNPWEIIYDFTSPDTIPRGIVRQG